MTVTRRSDERTSKTDGRTRGDDPGPR